MIEVDHELVELMSAVFAAHRAKRAAPPDGAAMPNWDSALWEQLDEVGLARLTGPEAGGGSGATWFGWPSGRRRRHRRCRRDRRGQHGRRAA